MIKRGVAKVALAAALLTLAPASGWARGQGGPDGGRRGPPPEAIAACEGKEAGDNVEFTGRRGETLQATCEEVEGQLVAVPEDRPERGADR